MAITPIGAPAITAPTTPAGAPRPAGAGGFGEHLHDALRQVDSLQHQADQAINRLATGERQSLHDTMIALEQADTSFKLMMQIRNKIVEAYHEVLRMQV